VARFVARRILLLVPLLFGIVLLAFQQVSTPVFALLLLGFVAYTAWILVAVWRSAENVGRKDYGLIARALTVAWAINSVLVSGFLLLGHLGTVESPLPLPF